MVEVVKLYEVPGQFEGRKRKFDRQGLIHDALATLTGLDSTKECVKIPTTINFRGLNIHNIIKSAALRRNMKVGVRVTDEHTYIWLKSRIV